MAPGCAFQPQHQSQYIMKRRIAISLLPVTERITPFLKEHPLQIEVGASRINVSDDESHRLMLEFRKARLELERERGGDMQPVRLTTLKSLISDAAEAVERIPEDELEAHAANLRREKDHDFNETM